MAGYIAPARDWKRFENVWTKTLLSAGLPLGVPFHMADFVARRKPFDWPDRKRDAVFKKLIAIMSRYIHFGIAIGIVQADYSEVAATVAEPASAYTFCTIRCLVNLGKWARSHYPEDRIAYVFESGAGYTGEFYRHVRAN